MLRWCQPGCGDVAMPESWFLRPPYYVLPAVDNIVDKIFFMYILTSGRENSSAKTRIKEWPACHPKKGDPRRPFSFYLIFLKNFLPYIPSSRSFKIASLADLVNFLGKATRM